MIKVETQAYVFSCAAGFSWVPTDKSNKQCRRDIEDLVKNLNLDIDERVIITIRADDERRDDAGKDQVASDGIQHASQGV